MAYSTLRNIHEVLLNGLIEVNRVCKKEDIPYYMISGTLLGAVRHKGFIPWDSDIDIGILREDYERFIIACKKELHSNFTLQTPETDNNSSVCFTRIRINETKLVSKENQGKNKQESLYIDVFPFDTAPVKITNKEKIKEKFIKILWRILSYRNGDIATSSNINRLVLNLLTLLSRPFSNKFINKLIKKIMLASSMEKSPYITNYASTYGSIKERQLKSDFGKPIRLEFEGLEFNAPSNFENVLKNLYGDYMTIPEKSKRKEIDFEKYIVDLGPYKFNLEKIKNEKI
ncbi:lipopolysaccharide cholinephosphotransferase [Planomicrobium sp. HSC-17F08]|nr:lipopolysaccharide cholinephosphotransferase [Planomicrobium sp. HSC-17F08]